MMLTALFQQALEELAQAQNAANKAHAAAAAALANVHKVMISFVLTKLKVPNCKIFDRSVFMIFSFSWEYLFRIFGIGFLQCGDFEAKI
jgi:hypothetical protein